MKDNSIIKPTSYNEVILTDIDHNIIDNLKSFISLVGHGRASFVGLNVIEVGRDENGNPIGMDININLKYVRK